MAQWKRIHLPMQEAHLGQEDPLAKEMATHCSILPEKSHGQSLAGYIVHGVAKESDMTSRLKNNSEL